MSVSAEIIQLPINSYREGRYEVPVDNPDLLMAAQFKLKKVRLEQNGQDFKIKYLVPVELTGQKNLLEFSGKITDGSGTLGYEDDQMTCKTEEADLVCQVKYKNLKFDQTLAEKILTERFKDQDLEKRLRIQKDFSTDPVGILRITLNQD